jgi:hypothetical protein
VVELGGNPSLPPDNDGDTIPDYHDIDSDNDTISDREEATSDVDGDTTPDRFDADSDNDTIPDAVEAGDENVATPAVDTDGDTVQDFRDPDSDGDGLADDLEPDTIGTDGLPCRIDPDCDNDGTNDMVEVAAGTDPINPADNPHARGDFVFWVPYNDPATHPPEPFHEPDPLEDTLIFSTNLQIADVYFLMDSTGSMGGTINNVTASLAGTIVPGLRTAIPDVQMGVGAFNDFPNSPFGDGMDQPYWHDQDITPDDAAVQTALNYVSARPRGSGNDWSESYVVALYLTASGLGTYDAGASVPPKTCPTYPEDTGPRTGYPCFRPGALPIVILIGDAPWHNYPGNPGNTGDSDYPFAPYYADALSALLGIGARVIGVCARCSGAAGDWAYQYQAALARDTGTVDFGGTPLVVISGDGTVATSLVDQVGILATSVPMRIDAVPVDDTSDTVNAPAEFIAYIEANASGESITDPVTGEVRVCTVTDPLPVDETADGHADYFPRVLPGTPVCFDIIPKRNVTVPATREPQMFKATIQVQGDRITILDERDVFFLVPPEIGIIIG